VKPTAGGGKGRNGTKQGGFPNGYNKVLEEMVKKELDSSKVINRRGSICKKKIARKINPATARRSGKRGKKRVITPTNGNCQKKGQKERKWL